MKSIGALDKEVNDILNRDEEDELLHLPALQTLYGQIERSSMHSICERRMSINAKNNIMP